MIHILVLETFNKNRDKGSNECEQENHLPRSSL
jgi:hypothetical protein